MLKAELWQQFSLKGSHKVAACSRLQSSCTPVCFHPFVFTFNLTSIFVSGSTDSRMSGDCSVPVHLRVDEFPISLLATPPFPFFVYLARSFPLPIFLPALGPDVHSRLFSPPQEISYAYEFKPAAKLIHGPFEALYSYIYLLPKLLLLL